MPRIAIPLTGGQNVDQPFNDKVVSREALNMTPEIQQYGDTILRCMPGYAADTTYSTGSAGELLATVTVNDKVFFVKKNGGNGDLYEYNPGLATITLKGSMTGMTGLVRMVTNGDNIVIVNGRGIGVSFPDYIFYVGGALSTIVSVDADYGSLGYALDVVYYQGYYFFINPNIVFHGDLRTEAGQGVAFNLLSFANLPFVNNEGRGIEQISGQIYVIGTTSMYIYNLAGTSPFVLQQQVGTTINVGIVTPSTKVVYNNILYLYGSQQNETPDFYKVTGINFEKFGNNNQVVLTTSINAGITDAIISAYIVRGDVIVTWRQSSTHNTYAYNDTVSQRTGIRAWFLIGGFDNAAEVEKTSLLVNTLPAFLDRTVSSSGVYSSRIPRLIFISASDSSSDVFISLYDENFTEISQDIISQSTALVTKFIFTFDYIRVDAEPFFIKKLRFKLIDKGMTAELQYTDGTNNKAGTSASNFDYISLGSIVPTSEGLVEWRRIGRVANQRTFRLILSNPDNQGLHASVSGGIISGEIIA